MNQQQYIRNIEEIYKDCVRIVVKKNNDYALFEDPFQNFRNSTVAGVPLEKGILVRIMDKITRMSHLLDKEPDVVTETIEDSIMDGINYLAILLTYLQREKGRTDE